MPNNHNNAEYLEYTSFPETGANMAVLKAILFQLLTILTSSIGLEPSKASTM